MNPLQLIEGEEGDAGVAGREPDDATFFFSTASNLAPSPSPASLGNSRIALRTEPDDTLDRARAARTERRRVRNAVARILRARADELELPMPRVSHCGHSVAGGGVTVVKGAQGIARISGLQRCANIWLCPECSARIRAGRATEIAQAANLWTRHRDGALLFVTLTVAHKAGDDVATLIDAVISSWSALTSSSWWAGDFRPDRPPRYGIKQRYGLAGYVRSIEVTDGPRNGLHAHVHALFFVDKTPGPEVLELLGDEIYDKWANHVVRRGAREPDRLHGVDVQLCGDDGTVLAQYLSKVVSETNVGFEMARSDVKRGRKWRRFTPFELAVAADEGDEWARQRFVDYAEATKGRRAITWSRDLRDVLGMAAEKTDEELLDEIEALDDMIGEPVLTMTNDEWRALRVVDGGPELLLDLVEGDRLEVARTLVTAAVAARGAP